MVERRAEILVVGAGPAGIAAAVRAAEAGRRVLLVDEAPAPGGQIWRREPGRAPAGTAARWLERLAAAGVEHRAGTTVIHAEGSALLYAQSASGLERLCAERVVLATGARERFLPFAGWTLPGVVGTGGAQALAKSGWRVAGLRVVVAGSGPLLLAVAAHLRRRGARVLAVVEQAPLSRLLGLAASVLGQPRKMAQLGGLLAGLAGVPRRYASWPVRAVGERRLEAVTLEDAAFSRRTLACDVLACGWGLVPETRLAELLGCAVAHGTVVVDALQQTSLAGVFCAGEPVGIGGVGAALVEGEIAGLAAAGAHAEARRLFARRRRERVFGRRLENAFALRPELVRGLDAETLVCRCEDVAWGRLEGSESWREAKLRTRCGMGACQGRVCGAALEFLRGWPAERPRPPLYPVPLGLLAGLASQTPETSFPESPT